MAKENETPGKVKELFSSFLSKLINKINDKEKELPSQTDRRIETTEESSLPDARNRNLFYDRVETFSPLTWFAKPLELSPLVCARYGWKNVDTDMLQCVNCKAFLCGQLPKAVETHVFRDRCNDLKKSLISGHEKLCKWSSNPSPESFLRVPLHDKEERLNKFWGRVASLQCSRIPEMTYDTMKTCGVTEAELLGYIDALRQTRPDHSNLQAEVAVCALCGWNYSEAQVDILQCEYCQRKIGLWNYTYPTPSTSPEKIPSNHSIVHIIGTDAEKHETCPNEKRLSNEEVVKDGANEWFRTNVIEKLETAKQPNDENIEIGKGIQLEQNGVNNQKSDQHREEHGVNTEEGINGDLIRKSIKMDGGFNGEQVNGEKRAGVEETDEPRRKRPRLEKKTFDPVAEHRYWCPWLQLGSVHPTTTAKSTLSDLGTSQESPLKSPPLQSPLFHSPPMSNSEPTGEPAWLTATKIITGSCEDDLSSHMKRSPQFEGLRHLRRVLRQCTSPTQSTNQQTAAT